MERFLRIGRCLGATAVALLLLLAVGGPASAADAPPGDPAQITAEQSIGPRVVELTISTPAFATPTHVDVDLPTGYESEPERRWPVAYFLAGTQNTYRSFNSVVNGVELTKDFPAIVVSPNGNSGYWSDWWNGGALGPPKYETYVTEQLIPLIDANFRTIADRAHRAVAGVSMGGYGAMMIAARHPDLFADAASISGADDSNNAALGAALSLSSTFDGGAVDAIYGPRATEEVRWRGHNPTDLAANLRDLNLQVRTANGIPNPGIGENLLSADSVSCVIEAGVYQGSVSLNQKLEELGIPHLWKDYGPGCHTKPNFEREITDTLATFTEEFANPPAPPSTFDYESIEPDFEVWGWHVAADPHRALEFMRMQGVGPTGLTLVGSGTTTVTSPPIFAGAEVVRLAGATTPSATPDPAGRITFSVDLGPPDTVQQYTSGADPAEVGRTVELKAYYPSGDGDPQPARGAKGETRLITGAPAKPCTVPKLTRAARQRRPAPAPRRLPTRQGPRPPQPLRPGGGTGPAPRLTPPAGHEGHRPARLSRRRVDGPKT